MGGWCTAAAEKRRDPRILETAAVWASEGLSGRLRATVAWGEGWSGPRGDTALSSRGSNPTGTIAVSMLPPSPSSTALPAFPCLCRICFRVVSPRLNESAPSLVSHSRSSRKSLGNAVVRVIS